MFLFSFFLGEMRDFHANPLGLPTDKVWHSDPAFRITLSVLGIFIVLVLCTVATAFLVKRKN